MRSVLKFVAIGVLLAACGPRRAAQTQACPYPAPTQQVQQAYPPPIPPGYPPPGSGYPPPPGYTYPTQGPGYAPLAQPPAMPPPVPASSDRFANARQQCFDLTNQYRARVGVGPVVRRTDKEPCSDAEADSDGRSGKAHGSFGKCSQGAQNECPGYDASSPERSLAGCLEQMFREGPGEPYSEHGHYLNMTKASYRGVACGFAVNPKGQLWITQNFFP